MCLCRAVAILEADTGALLEQLLAPLKLLTQLQVLNMPVQMIYLCSCMLLILLPQRCMLSRNECIMPALTRVYLS